MAYRVDTNIIVDVTRGSAGAADYLDSLGNDWSISMITYLELLAGARTQRETADLDLVLSGYRAILPNEDIARRAYYLVKAYAQSHGLDALDALIAAMALEEAQAVPDDRRSKAGSARVLMSRCVNTAEARS
jgi:predicted nucleic acid-binding protein